MSTGFRRFDGHILNMSPVGWQKGTRIQLTGGIVLQLPLHRELNSAETVLIAGCGGGFDIFSGLPLYFALRDAGKTVHLANLTFSNVPPSAGQRPVPELVEVTATSNGSKYYFPEKHLAQWFAARGEEISVWCIERFGPAAV